MQPDKVWSFVGKKMLSFGTLGYYWGRCKGTWSKRKEKEGLRQQFLFEPRGQGLSLGGR